MVSLSLYLALLEEMDEFSISTEKNKKHLDIKNLLLIV